MKLFEIKQTPNAPGEKELEAAGKVLVDVLKKDPHRKRYADNLEKAMQLLVQWVKADKVWNTEFNEQKYWLSNGYEKALDYLGELPVSEAVMTGNRHGLSNRFLSYYYSSGMSDYAGFVGVKKQLRIAEEELAANPPKEVKDILVEWIKCLKAGQIVGQAMDSVKPKLEKGRKPKEPDPNQFRNTMGSDAAQKLVRTQLKKTIDPLLEVYKKALVDFYTRQFDEIKKNKSIPFKAMPSVGPKWDVFKKCFEFEMQGEAGPGKYVGRDLTYPNDKREYINIKPKKDWSDVIDRMAQHECDIIEQHFLTKNIMKLSNLVDKKGNLKKIVPLPTHPPKLANGVATIEAGYDFLFNDNSQFTVTNKVIVNTSPLGKWFYQYPTTFHDVKLANGERVKSPSEEKMIKVFAEAK
jgi:hypothetical protein